MKRKAKHFKGKPVNKTLDAACRTLDKLAAVEELMCYIDPELLGDLRQGLSAKELRDKYSAKVTARQISIALKAPAEKANGAIRDILDRTEGRPTEKKEISHRLEKLNDEQLQAMLLTELEDLQAKKSH